MASDWQVGVRFHHEPKTKQPGKGKPAGVGRRASSVRRHPGLRGQKHARDMDAKMYWNNRIRHRTGLGRRLEIQEAQRKEKKKWWPPLASIRPKLFASLLAPFLVGDGLLAGGSMTIRFRLHCFFPIQIHGCGEQTSYICHVATMPDNSAARAETALFVLGLLLRGRRREGVTLVG